MPQKPAQKTKQTVQKNPYETLKNTSTSRALDRLMGTYQDDEMDLMEQYLKERKREPKEKKQRQEFSLFRYQEYHEQELVRKQITQLTEEIKKEIIALKGTGSGLAKEVQEVEKLTLQPLPEKPGIYHIRFLEIVLNLIRVIRLKIGESKTWLEAMISKKKKRGSLFMSLSKKKGTQYSLSQELQSARSVQ